MTKEQIEAIPFHFQCHMSMEDEHTATYMGYLPGHTIGYCVHTPYVDGRPKGRAYVHYRLDGEVFKSRKKFLEALTMLAVPKSLLEQKNKEQ